MHTKYLIIDQSSQGQVIEYLSTVFPDIQRTVFPETLVVEAVDLGDLPAFVVASQEGDSRLIAYFEGEQEDEGLYAVETPVDKISHEEVGNVGRISSYFEELEEVIELSMDVSTDCNRRVDAGKIGLLCQDFLGLVAQEFNTGLFYELVVFYLAENLVHSF